MLSSIERRVGESVREPTLNTPESIDLQRLFREMLASGNRTCAMEATSIAASKHRLDGTRSILRCPAAVQVPPDCEDCVADEFVH